MKKSLILVLVSLGFATQIFADNFTDAIQDLAIQTACLGQYSATEAGGGWYEDPHDYYTPQMMAGRFAEMSGNMTRIITFYGVCFDYAQFAWQDVDNNKYWFNQQGMFEGQFWIAGNHEDENLIILSNPTTKDKATEVQNGVYIKTYPTSNRSVKTHKGVDGKRATHHAWLWIERADGVWFWVDPTWTDNLGYVVYGYVKNGEEIQCRPDEYYDSPLLEKRPAYLNNLPLPPPMGTKLAPSSTANSSNREETINDAAPDLLTELVGTVIEGFFSVLGDAIIWFFEPNYFLEDEWWAFFASADIPFSSFAGGGFKPDKMGYAIEGATLVNNSGSSLIGLEYLINRENENNLHGFIAEVNVAKRLFNNFTWYLGGGIGLRFDFSNESNKPGKIDGIVDSGYFAWKASTGCLVNFKNIFTKIEASYNNVIGFSTSVGIGFGIEPPK